VNMPNDTGVRNDPPSKYFTTVDKIEDATGYDILSLLPVAFQGAIEAGDHSPKASYTSSGTPSEGSAITFDASSSTDPDIGRTDLGRTEALTYVWHFSDGTNATGDVVTHTFANNGTYTASLTVTDAFGWQSLTWGTVSIANVAPTIAALAGATLLVGETYSTPGSFMDPGTDPWSATADYGDGSGASALALNGQAFTLDHRYGSAGSFDVAVTINDGDATVTSHANVIVESSLQGITHLLEDVDVLGGPDGALGRGEINSLQAKLQNANRLLSEGKKIPAAALLGAFALEMDALVVTRRLPLETAQPINAYARRVIRSIGS
jgi:PKD domain